MSDEHTRLIDALEQMAAAVVRLAESDISASNRERESTAASAGLRRRMEADRAYSAGRLAGCPGCWDRSEPNDYYCHADRFGNHYECHAAGHWEEHRTGKAEAFKS